MQTPEGPSRLLMLARELRVRAARSISLPIGVPSSMEMPPAPRQRISANDSLFDEQPFEPSLA